MIFLEEVHDGDAVPTEHEGQAVEDLGTLLGGDMGGAGGMPVNTLTAEDVARYAAEQATAAAREEARRASEAAKARGNAAFGAKRFGEALAAYSEAIELDGSNALLFGNRSAAHLGLGDAAAAKADAASMISLAPTLAKAHFRLGAACERLNDSLGAAEAFAEALRIDPSSFPSAEAVRRLVGSAALKADPAGARLLQKCNATLAVAKHAAAKAAAPPAAARAAVGYHRSIEWVKVDVSRGTPPKDTPGTPAARGGATLSALGGSLWLVGGADRSGAEDEAVWEYRPGPGGVEHSAGAWLRHEPSGDPFKARNGHAAAATGCGVLVYGGKDGADELLEDLFLLRVGHGGLVRWERLAAEGVAPGSRAEHSLCWSGGLGYVFGGADEAGLKSDLLRLSPPSNAEGGLYTWSAPECSGARPSPRGMHAAAVAEPRGRAPLLVLHGGRGGEGSTPLDDLFLLCLRSLTWSKLETTTARFGHSAAWLALPHTGGEGAAADGEDIGGEMLLFGGIKPERSGAKFYHDTHRLALPPKETPPKENSPAAGLQRVRGRGEPSKRFAHCSAALGATLYVSGGSHAAAEMADLYAGELE